MLKTDEERRKSGRRLGNDRRMFSRRLEDSERKLRTLLKEENEDPAILEYPQGMYAPVREERRKSDRRQRERRSGVDRRG